MEIRINTGRAVKKSAKNGKPKKMIFDVIEIKRDNSERERFDASKHLPHQGDREIARRAARMPKPLKKAA